MKNGLLIGFLIVLSVILLGVFAFGGIYNQLVRADENVKNAWSQVQNVYQRRMDLIPNLVETVKGYATFERQTLQGVVEARSKISQMNVSSNIVNDPEALTKFQALQGELSSALSRLLVVVERYPELKAGQNFLALQSQLEGTENRISVERKRFNDAALQFNALRRTFPGIFVADMMGFKEKAYFQADQGAAKAPTVKFSSWRRWPRVAFFFGILFLNFACPLSALEIPARPDGYVTDKAGLLSSQNKAKLEAFLRNYEQETSNQIVVTTFPSLDGESLEDFSIRLAEKWKIGKKGKDNGVILVIFKNDRKIRIEVGYGLEGVLSDANCKMIIENEIAPAFRQGKFDEGIVRAVEAIKATIKGEYTPKPVRRGRRGSLSLDSLMNIMILLIIISSHYVILLVLILGSFIFAAAALTMGQPLIASYAFIIGIVLTFVYFLWSRIFGSRMVLSRTGSAWRRGGYWAGSGFGGGSFGGGGFSGGGGSFGGGGASGSW